MKKVESGMEVSLFSSSEQSFLLSVIGIDFLKLPEVVTFCSSWMEKPFFCSMFTCVKRGRTLDRSSSNLARKKTQTCHKALVLWITRKEFVGQEATVWELLCQGLTSMREKPKQFPLTPPSPAKALNVFSPYMWLYSLVMKFGSSTSAAKSQVKYIVITQPMERYILFTS